VLERSENDRAYPGMLSRLAAGSILSK
jgi:hypothetical protein